jgi:UDP-GlcNAc:undecaprenyl-phosphate GlcNAc-1-phosphate transferase
MIDGHDGLAASMFIITAGTLLLLSGLSGAWKIQYLLGLFCISVCIFLYFNLTWMVGQSRQIFLGDAGSMLLGLVLVYSVIILSETEVPIIKRTAAPWILGLPLMDMCAVVILRIVRRVSVINADRRHIHHLLSEKGFSKKSLLLILISFQVFLCTVGLIGTIWNFPDWVLFWFLFPVWEIPNRTDKSNCAKKNLEAY